MRAARRDALAGLDAHAVPAVAAVLRGIGRALRAVAGPDAAIGRRVAPWVRREPVIAVAILCVAFAAILIAVTGGDEQGAVPPPSHIGPRLASGRPLGPQIGTSVSTYESQASARRDALDQVAGSQQVLAVVDLDSYVTPRAVDELMAEAPGVAVLRGFARVPPPQDAPVHVLLTSEQDLASGLSAAAQSASKIALHYERELSRSITRPSTALQGRVEAGAAQAAQARIDASGLGPTCGCVFALVVSGPAAGIQDLAGQGAVRILDPAPLSATLNSLQIVPLEPQVTDVVPALTFAGD